jgi:hypothetical protein
MSSLNRLMADLRTRGIVTKVWLQRPADVILALSARRASASGRVAA